MISILALVCLSQTLGAPKAPLSHEWFSVAKDGMSFVRPGPKSDRFWSFGVCCTGIGSPWETTDPTNPAYSAYRIFPSGKAWVDDTLKKFSSWQFNSLGGWSDIDLFKKHANKQMIPYFVVLHLGSYDKAPWHDLFSREMERAVDNAAKTLIPPLAADKNLVGYFSDNELGWWDDTLFLTYLQLPARAPGKLRMVQLFERFYRGDFQTFQRDWITSATAFEGICSVSDLRIRPNGRGGLFLNEWIQDLAEHYYSLMERTIRRYDRNHLILGDRFCQYYSVPVARAMQKHADVASTNLGADWNDGSISHFFLSTLHEATGKPVIITEFYLCAMENRSGNRNSSGGFPIVQTQAERADGFKRYVKSVASIPFVLGAHWFQFTDEPSKGRGDGENYNMGLVDIAGRPYEEITKVASSLNFKDLRTGALISKPEKTLLIPKAPIDPMKGVKLWPRGTSFVSPISPLPIADLYAVHDAHFLYLALYEMEYMDERIYEGNHVPGIERSKWTIQIEGIDDPIEVTFGGKGMKLNLKANGIESAYYPDLKSTVILKIPFPTAARVGHEFILHARLDTHSRRQTVLWNQVVRVSP